MNEELEAQQADMLLKAAGLRDGQVTTALGALRYDLNAGAREEAALFDKSGLPLRSDRETVAAFEAIGRKENEARDRFVARMKAIAEPVIAILAEAQTDLRRAEAVDPLESLGVSDTARANALRPFVRESSLSLGLKGLIERLRALAAGDDRVSAALYLRYARERLEKESGRVEAHPLDPDYHTLETAIRDLEGVALGKDEAERRKRLRAKIANGESIMTRLVDIRNAGDEREIRRRFGLGDPPRRLQVVSHREA